MNNTRKSNNKKQNAIFILCCVFAVVLVIMVVALLVPKTAPKGEFVPPPFESAAVQGTPTVGERLAYQEVYRDGMAYRLSVCCVPTVSGKELTVFFTSAEGNEKYLKLRVMDEQGNILGETGLLKAGEYVKTVTLSETLSAGTRLKLKVMGYEPADYTSAGSIAVNVTIGGAS